MLRSLTSFFLSTFFSSLTLGQYGTAPNGYYPENYFGTTFSGVVSEGQGNTITLTYTKGKRTETFIGTFETGCSVPTADKSQRLMTPSDIPKGTVLTAYFIPTSKKVSGKKIKENRIIAITFEVWEGQKVPDDKKRIYPCGGGALRQFKVF